MARSNLSRLAWSMEDEEILAEMAEEAGEAGEGEDLSGEDSVEAEVIEVQEADQQVAETDAAIEDTITDAESMESIYYAMEGFRRTGGMSKDVAFMAQVGLDNVLARYPHLSLRDIGQPSLESFGSAGSRLSRTTASMEGIRQMLSDFWAMIMKQINKLTAYIRNWYLKVLDAAPRLKKRAEAIAEKAGNVSGTIENKKIDVGVLRELSFAGKPVAKAQLIKSLEVFKDGIDTALSPKSADGYETAMTELLDILEKAVDGKLDSERDAAVAQKAAVTNPDGSIKTPAVDAKAAVSYKQALEKALKVTTDKFGTFESKAGDDKRWNDKLTPTLSPELLGNKCVVKVELTTPANAGLKDIASGYYVKMDNKNPKQKSLDSTGSFETLSTGDVETVAKTVADICEQIMVYKKAWEGREKQQKRMDSEVKKAISQSEKSGDDGEGKTTAKQVRECGDAIQKAWRNGVQFESQLINFGIKTGRAALTYCERSLNEHKK